MYKNNQCLHFNIVTILNNQELLMIFAQPHTVGNIIVQEGILSCGKKPFILLQAPVDGQSTRTRGAHR